MHNFAYLWILSSHILVAICWSTYFQFVLFFGFFLMSAGTDIPTVFHKMGKTIQITEASNPFNQKCRPENIFCFEIFFWNNVFFLIFLLKTLLPSLAMMEAFQNELKTVGDSFGYKDFLKLHKGSLLRQPRSDFSSRPARKVGGSAILCSPGS